MFDLPEWWSRPGLPGMSTDAGPVTGAPWTWAGHVRGAWRLDEPGRAPLEMPFPGVMLAPTPIAFYDSVETAAGPGGRSHPALARGTGLGTPRSDRDARSVIALRNGSFGLDESALMFERGDSLAWARAETSSGNRGGVGGWDRLSRHAWGIAAGGGAAHAFDLRYAQRGGAGRLAAGEEQSSSGESGAIAYRRHGGPGFFGIEFARGHDFHESMDPALVYSRRDAQWNALRADAALDHGAARSEGALEWSEGRIDRAFDRAARARGAGLWSRFAHTRAAGEGVLTLRLGAGTHPRAGGFHLTPGAEWRTAGRGGGARIFVERVTESVWADLAPGQAPFLQATWTGGLEVGARVLRRRSGATDGRLAFQFGQTRQRAVVTRRPLDDLWLREGFRADPERYTFGLLSGGGHHSRGPFEVEADAFALLRDRSSAQTRVDPGAGFRVRIGTRFEAFTGDLGIRLAALMDGVGARETDAVPAHALPGYVTFGAAAELTLAEVVIAIEMLNLEDRRREQVWIDYVTGQGAAGPGRTLRMMLTWRLSG
jgi:hypothetical protein